MSDIKRRLAVVENENETLRERVAVLEKSLGMRFDAPLCLGLAGSEAILFGVMMAREIMTKEAALVALYSDRLRDEPDQKIVDVFICKLRKKLKRFGLAVETQWGRGYYFTAETKGRIRALGDITQAREPAA